MHRFLVPLCMIASVMCGSAHAQSAWWLRAGVATIQFDESATVSIGGAQVPGAGLSVKNNTTAGFELGYDLNDRLAIGFTFGVPPETEVRGEGAAAGFGSVGKAKYGPAVLTLQGVWPVAENWRLQAGAGVARLVITQSSDGAIAGLKVKDAWGSAVQASATYKLSSAWGVFLDVKKIWIKTTATGTIPALGGAPAEAHLTLNPVVVHAGMTWRF